MTRIIYRLKFRGALSALKTVHLAELRDYVKTLEHMSDDQIIQLGDNAIEAHTRPAKDALKNGNSTGSHLHFEAPMNPLTAKDIADAYEKEMDQQKKKRRRI